MPSAPGAGIFLLEFTNLFGTYALDLIEHEGLKGSDIHQLHKIMTKEWDGDRQLAMIGVLGVLETPGESRKRLEQS